MNKIKILGDVEESSSVVLLERNGGRHFLLLRHFHVMTLLKFSEKRIILRFQ